MGKPTKKADKRKVVAREHVKQGRIITPASRGKMENFHNFPFAIRNVSVPRVQRRGWVGGRKKVVRFGVHLYPDTMSLANPLFDSRIRKQKRDDPRSINRGQIILLRTRGGELSNPEIQKIIRLSA